MAERLLQTSQRGAALLIFVILVVTATLTYLVNSLTPETVAAKRAQQTSAALAQARDALIGYALQYRDQQAAHNPPDLDAMYGFLPMPDVGTSRFHASQTTACNTEGCAMSFVNGTFPATTDTVIGRLPWRTLGIGPLRDGDGECLWYAVSAAHKNLGIDPAISMNWDTLGQLDFVEVSGSALVAKNASAYDRPVAIIFSPGAQRTGQDRCQDKNNPTECLFAQGNEVTQCGGNYAVANYLDTTQLAPLFTSTNGASGDTNNPPSNPPKPFSTKGKIPTPESHLANDTGLPVTSDTLFGAIRKNAYFRTDINSMLGQISTCLRDQVAALGGGNFPLDTNSTGLPAPPSDKTAGRIPTGTCYNDAQNPLGYFSHYKDQLFVAACPNPASNSCLTVTDTNNTVISTDDTSASCPAVLIFGSQRGAKSPVPTDSGESLVQLRNADPVSTTNTLTNANWLANYLEGTNLTSFTTNGALSFTGPTQFTQVTATPTASQLGNQDIVRCIPAGASLSVVAPTVTATAGDIQLAKYSPGTRTLTLGSADINSNYGASAAQLFACAWTPETHSSNGGFRSYFRFRIRRVGEGFTFAVIDGDRNGADVCGAARQHLGYSGDNGVTPYIQPPKLAIEFDTARNCNSPIFDAVGRPMCQFTESGNTLSNGRNDPCYTTSCWEDSPLYPGTKQSLDNSSHVAVVYWGYGSTLTMPTQDDNAHDQADDNSGTTSSTPMPTDPSPRPGPRNPAPVLPYVSDPATIPGIAPLDRMGNTDMSQREFHARVEVTRTFTSPTDAKDGATNVAVKFWIEPQPAKSISAMSYNPGSPPTLTVTAASHGLETGTVQNPTYVVIKDAIPSGYNGEYVISKIDANNFSATLPAGTPNPGPYISAMTWADVSGSDNDLVTVTSTNHGLNTGDTITISDAIPTEYNGTYAITVTDVDSYSFSRELDYQPGPLPPAVATTKTLTPRAQSLTNTTRPMSQLYPGTTPDTTFKPLVANTAIIYDEQTVACGAGCPSGQTCGSDNMCYRPSFRNLRLGFTLSERPTTGTGSNSARGQLIDITDRATTWLP